VVIGPDTTRDEIAQQTYRALNDKIQQLTLLLDQHGIDRKGNNRWFLLACKLADKYEPAFQPLKTLGRPPKWSEDRLLILAGEIWREIKAGARTQRIAAKRLAAREPWRSFIDRWTPGRATSAEPHDAILDAYKRVSLSQRRKGEQLCTRAMGLGQWDSLVQDALERKGK